MGFNQEKLKEIREKRLRNFVIEVVNLVGGTGCNQSVEDYADDVVKRSGGDVIGVANSMSCFDQLKRDRLMFGQMFSK